MFAWWHLFNAMLAFSVEITESSNTTGALEIRTKETAKHLVIATFPDHVLPHIKNVGVYKVHKQNQKTAIAFYLNGPAHVKVRYEKAITKIADLKYKIERGFEFDPVVLVKKDAVVMSNKVTDIFPIPDFSVCFISFSTCGAIFGLIFNLFMNKA